MAISPVSSVSFNRNNMATNVAFEGKKNKGENHRGMTNSLRAVPLAALIAMSPMVNVQAQNFSDNDKIIASLNFDKARDFGGNITDPCEINFISSDGNDSDIEKVRLRFVSPSSEYRNINGKRTRLSYAYTSDIYVDTLLVSNDVRRYKDGTVSRSNSYYVAGPMQYTRSYPTTENGELIMDKNFHFIKRYNSSRIRITKEFYDYLKECMEDDVVHKTVTREIDGDKEVEDEFNMYLY